MRKSATIAHKLKNTIYGRALVGKVECSECGKYQARNKEFYYRCKLLGRKVEEEGITYPVTASKPCLLNDMEVCPLI